MSIQSEELKKMPTLDLMLMLKDCSVFEEDKDWKLAILNELKTRKE